jgi:hypothetical protein
MPCPLQCSIPGGWKTAVGGPIFEVWPESSRFERVFEKALLDCVTDFVSARYEKLAHRSSRTLENTRRIRLIDERTEPGVKSAGSCPPILNLVIFSHILPNVFEEIALKLSCR